jgi:hypothetical protein
MIPAVLLSVLLSSAVAAPETAPEAPLAAPSLLGSGLLSLHDTRTLPRGRFTIGTTLHNRDRDPLGIDVFDYAIAGTVGVTPRVEAFGSLVFSRVVVVPDFSLTWPALAPPPLDLVLPDAMAVPERPYYAMVPTFPFANGRGDQRFSDLVTGDLVLGAKMRLRAPDGERAGFAVSGEVKVPSKRRLTALQSGSGTGGIDLALRGIAEKKFLGADVVTSAAFIYVGGVPFGDRLLMANPEATAVVEEKLRLPSRFELGAGLRYPVSPGLALIAEAVATVEVYGADTLDRIAPLDLLAGFQGRRGPIRLTAGVLYAAGSPPSGGVRPSPLAGFVDLSRASDADTRRYLEQGGLGGAAAHLRPWAQVVTPRVPGAELPEGARVVPDRYTIISEHQIGFVVLLGWAF